MRAPIVSTLAATSTVPAAFSSSPSVWGVALVPGPWMVRATSPVAAINGTAVPLPPFKESRIGVPDELLCRVSAAVPVRARS